MSSARDLARRGLKPARGHLQYVFLEVVRSSARIRREHDDGVDGRAYLHEVGMFSMDEMNWHALAEDM